MLARLRHSPVRRAHHEYRAVHLRRARDHILDIVRVAGAVHMRVVPGIRLILHMLDSDSNAALLLFRRVVDAVERPEIREPRAAQNLRYRRRQGRLAVVHMPDCANIDVGFSPFEPLLSHLSQCLQFVEPTSRLELLTSFLPRTRSTD